MVEEIFENSSLIRGALLRFRDLPEVSALRENGQDAETEAGAWILAQYLQYAGAEKVSVVSGTIPGNPDDLTHTWVEADGVTADISAERFPASHTLIVISAQSVFHSLVDSPSRTNVTPASLKKRGEYVEAYRTLLRKHPALKNPAGSQVEAV
jgi:hypothetical protein